MPVLPKKGPASRQRQLIEGKEHNAIGGGEIADLLRRQEPTLEVEVRIGGKFEYGKSAEYQAAVSLLVRIEILRLRSHISTVLKGDNSRTRSASISAAASSSHSITCIEAIRWSAFSK